MRFIRFVIAQRHPDSGVEDGVFRLAYELRDASHVEVADRLLLAENFTWFNAQFGGAFTLSPDGSLMASVAQEGESGRPQLYIRRLGQLAAVPLPGTEGALAPFFSPDGAWIGFFAVPGRAAVT